MMPSGVGQDALQQRLFRGVISLSLCIIIRIVFQRVLCPALARNGPIRHPVASLIVGRDLKAIPLSVDSGTTDEKKTTTKNVAASP